MLRIVTAGIVIVVEWLMVVIEDMPNTPDHEDHGIPKGSKHCQAIYLLLSKMYLNMYSK